MKQRGFARSSGWLAFVAAVLLWVQPSLVSADGVNTVAVYRFYYGGGQVHLYSLSPAVPGVGWQAEGVAFWICPVNLPYTVPLYSVYGAALRDHLYTVDEAEKNTCVGGLGYTDQGILGYVLPPDAGAMPDVAGSAFLYRFVHRFEREIGKPFGASQSGIFGSPLSQLYQDHFYQTSPSTPATYTSEGKACRVWTAAISLPQSLLRIDSPAPGQTLQVGQIATIGWRVWSGGGTIKLSFSRDNGSSWQAITSVPSSGNFGVMNKATYPWTVPAEALNKVVIRADWTKDASGSTPPLATAMTGEFAVNSATTPAPNAPALTAALKGDREAYLSWTSSSSGVTGFSVERKIQGGTYAVLTIVGKSVRAYDDTSLAFGTTYVFRIRAWIGGKPSTPSNEVTLATPELRLGPARRKT